MAEAIVDLLEVVYVQHHQAAGGLSLPPLPAVLEEIAAVVEAGQLVGFALQLEPLLQLVLAGNVAGHPGHRPLAVIAGGQRRNLALEALHPLRSDRGVDPLHLHRRQLVLHHLHLARIQRQGHLLHHPAGHVGGQHIGQSLARQRVAILIGLLLHPANVFDVVAVFAQDEDGIGQLGHHFI